MQQTLQLGGWNPYQRHVCLGAWLNESGRRLPAGEHGVDIVERGEAHLVARFNDGCAHMRQQEDIFQLIITGVDIRLAFVHIEPRIANLSRLQRSDQIVVVDEIAARGVHDNGAARELRQRRRVDRAASLGRRRRADRQHVAHGEQAVERVVIDRALLVGGVATAAIIIMNLHVEGAGALGDGLSDLAQPHNAEPLAVESAPNELHGLPTARLLVLQKPFALRARAGPSRG